MCDPTGGIATTGIALALSAAGSIANNQAQKKAVNRSENFTRQELARQKELRKKGYERLDETRQQFDRPKQEGDLDRAADDRTNFLSDLLEQGRSEYEGGGGVNQPRVVRSEVARKLSDALRFGQQQAAALGKLGAWDDLFRGNRDILRNSAVDIALTGDAARRSADIHEIEKYNALQSGGSLFADLLSAGGQALGTYGATRPVTSTGYVPPNFNRAATTPHFFSYGG